MGVKTGRNLGLGLLYQYPISIQFPSTPESQCFWQMCRYGFGNFVSFVLYCTTQDLAKFETFTEQRARCHLLVRSRGAHYINLRWHKAHDIKRWLLNISTRSCSAEATVACVAWPGLATVHIVAVQKPAVCCATVCTLIRHCLRSLF